MKSLWLGRITKKSYNCFVPCLISLPPFSINIAMLHMRYGEIEFCKDFVSDRSQVLRVLEMEGSSVKISFPAFSVRN